MYRRAEHWRFRIWPGADKKYAIKGLGLKKKMIALERGKDNLSDDKLENRAQ
jgi:hypothetical protein